jgi:hypothetical protein
MGSSSKGLELGAVRSLIQSQKQPGASKELKFQTKSVILDKAVVNRGTSSQKMMEGGNPSMRREVGN